MYNSEFQFKLLSGLLHSCYDFQENNVEREGKLTRRVERWFQERILVLAKRCGFVRRSRGNEIAAERLTRMVLNIDKLEAFYHMLEDEYSKQLLVEILKFRILGAKRVRLPRNNKEYWEKRRSIDKSFLQERRTIRAGDWFLNRYRLQGDDGPMDLHVHEVNVLNTFMLEQYAYQKGNTDVRVKPGDIVIDAGGCWGDATLYFASKAGKNGKVFCFEFVHDNLAILKRNIELNNHLLDTIEVVPMALWDKSGDVVRYSLSGPSTSLTPADEQLGTLQVSTVTIDDFVKEKELDRVDFIKIDIEGAELRALQGSEQTIRTFSPRLAISLYHRDDDFIVIPDYLKRLNLNYKYFLDHFTIHKGETVLFASPMDH